MVYNPEFNFLFVHIQKTAGTSITKALLNIPSSQFIAPPHLRLRDLTFKTEKMPYVFAVVRNPWTRIISWYEMMLRKGIHNDFSSYLLGCNNSLSEPERFSKFIRRIEVIEEREISELAKVTIYSGNDHFNLADSYLKSLSFNQVDYLTTQKNIIHYDRVLRFESLALDWADLVKKLNLPVSSLLTHENVNPNLSNPLSHYYRNTDNISWILNLYQRDIKLFGYDFPA